MTTRDKISGASIIEKYTSLYYGFKFVDIYRFFNNEGYTIAKYMLETGIITNFEMEISLLNNIPKCSVCSMICPKTKAIDYKFLDCSHISHIFLL